MKYSFTATNLRAKKKPVVSESGFISAAAARHAAERFNRPGFGLTIECDSEGADHPENAGKYFLHQIIR